MPRRVKSVVSSQGSVVRKEISSCFLSAALLLFSFPRLNLWFLAWFGFVPLFLALKGKSKIKAFLLSYLTGVIFWTGTIYWLIHVTLLGQIVLILYLALYFGFFGLIFSTIDYRLSTIDCFSIPSSWVLLEYLRSHLFTGFPWALLAYSQTSNLPVIQIADITGAWGVSFLVMIVNVAVYVIARRRIAPTKQSQNRDCFPFVSLGVVMTIVLLLAVLIYGYFKLCLLPNTKHRIPVKVAVVQGNIPQELKWNPNLKGFILDKYLRLTKEAAKENPDLIVWPEASLPVVVEEEPGYLIKAADTAKQANSSLLIGAVSTRDNNYYNSALLVSKQGEKVKQYDKLHLVPFGEYIPLREIFPFLQVVVPIGNVAAGKEYTMFEIRNPKSEILNKSQIPMSKNENKFSVLICFEDLFPELSREFVKRGAAFLVNITNDAWYKYSSAAYQHFQASVFRAVENRVPLARAANTGVSGFIAPSGKVISLVEDAGEEIFVEGFKTESMEAPQIKTFYNRYGDFFISACFLFCLYSIKLALKNKMSKS